MSAFAPIHSVHFYDTNKALIDRLCGIVSSGLDIGNAILIVATADHRDQLLDALAINRVDVAAHTNEDRLTLCDAKEMLSRFMVAKVPNPTLFSDCVGKLMNKAKASAISKEHGLVVFGEMVALLWDEGNHEGALALERLWNGVLNERAFHMHCAYPRDLFAQDEGGMANICDSHSHVVGALSRPN